MGTDIIKKNIQEHARVAQMLATALESGMRTLKQDGIEKVLMESPISSRCARFVSSSRSGGAAMSQTPASPDSGDLLRRLEQLLDIVSRCPGTRH